MRRRGPSWVYPDRKRCRACRRYFGFLVIDGLYDSWECAGRDPWSADPQDWPREHYVPLPQGERREKKAYLHSRDAERKAKRHGKEAYQCSYCRYYHIGTLNPMI